MMKNRKEKRVKLAGIGLGCAKTLKGKLHTKSRLHKKLVDL